MNYWVIKGRPEINDFDDWFANRDVDKWITKRPPRDWQKGDRLFFWASSPEKKVVGLGEFVSVEAPDEEGYYLFNVRYLSKAVLKKPLGMEFLRRNTILKSASFLKSGPAQTVYRLTNEQGETLYSLVLRANLDANVWGSDNSTNKQANDDDDPILDASYPEGKLLAQRHLQRERNRLAVEDKKQSVLRVTGDLRCEACGFDFKKTYGALGDGFAECHHTKPLAELTDEHPTKLTELAILCANCHRMIHRSKPMLTVLELRRIVNKHRG